MPINKGPNELGAQLAEMGLALRRVFADVGVPTRQFLAIMDGGVQLMLVPKTDYDAVVRRAEDAESELRRVAAELVALKANQTAFSGKVGADAAMDEFTSLMFGEGWED